MWRISILTAGPELRLARRLLRLEGRDFGATTMPLVPPAVSRGTEEAVFAAQRAGELGNVVGLRVGDGVATLFLPDRKSVSRPEQLPELLRTARQWSQNRHGVVSPFRLVDRDDDWGCELDNAGWRPQGSILRLERQVDPLRRVTSNQLPRGFSSEAIEVKITPRLVAITTRTYDGSMDFAEGANAAADLADHVRISDDRVLSMAPRREPCWWLLNRAPADRISSEPVGLILYRPTKTDQIQLLYVGIAPEHRERGLGSALLGHTMALHAAQGVKRFDVQVLSTNAPALRCYLACNFYRVGIDTIRLRD